MSGLPEIGLYYHEKGTLDFRFSWWAYDLAERVTALPLSIVATQPTEVLGPKRPVARRSGRP